MTAAHGWLSDVTFWVDGVPSGGSALPPPPGGGAGVVPTGGQGFSLSREDAEAALRDFQDILDELVRMEAQAGALTVLRSAAEDPASRTFHEILVGGGGQGLGVFGDGYEHVQKEIAFFEVLVARLKKALGYVTDADEDAEAHIGAAGGAVARDDRGYLE
ncbi:hypothetical protein ACQPZU_19810 [Saccharomonospora azurea]|uniref:hypothetical protein n=1 Tax=Saccharomonospora azurea TaxID=40988 RepID=UPI003D91C7C6